MPDLPAKIVSLAIPPGAIVTGVEIDAAAGERRRYEETRDAIYGSDDPFPAEPGVFARTSSYRKYSLVDLRITPVSYHPVSGRLLHHPEVTIAISWSLPAGTPVNEGDAGRPAPGRSSRA